MNQDGSINTDGEPKELIHAVAYGDTLEGLSLQCEVEWRFRQVPISKIRLRNHIEGDCIYHLKEIMIPNATSTPVSKEQSDDLKVEEFTAYMEPRVTPVQHSGTGRKDGKILSE